MEYRFATWICLIPAAIAGVILIVGVVLLISPRRRRAGLWTVLGAFLFAVLFGPMLFLDRVIITPERIDQRTGFWFVPTRKGFAYRDVQRVEIRVRTTRHGLENEIWTVVVRDGSRCDIDPGDLWQEHSEEIAGHLARYGVPVLRR